MVCASILGDISEDKQRETYLLLLGQYVWSDRVKHWTDDQRKGALRLAREP